MAQGLRVSNAGLMHLHLYLESRLILLESGGVKAEKLLAVQRMIVDEVIRRFVHETYSLDEVQAKIITTEQHEFSTAHSYYGAMPFISF